VPIDESKVEEIAARILAASDAVRSIPPITDGIPEFDLADAYRVSAAITRTRIARGERPVGWKIGFTNRTIWDEYGVHAPIWGPVYDTTATAVSPSATIDAPLAGLSEPRIEPEIVFRIAAPPDPAMDDRALFGCIDGITHGFEIVQSVFPGWRFKAADTVAAFALHARLYHGAFAAPSEGEGADGWIERLGAFEIVLSRDGAFVDRGQGANVLGSPLAALGHFVRGLDRVSGEHLKPGDVVTTGTVTRAFPVSAGETWQSEIVGLPLQGLTIRFT
jgi:2-oxo-3-hexenedioate decarboxylase